MISLESLFHPSDQAELRYRISRNTAVLLGRNKKYDSVEVYSNIRQLYDKRSKIVHTGMKGIINNDDLLNLRSYVRESIKMIIGLNKNKEDMLNLLNKSGFN